MVDPFTMWLIYNSLGGVLFGGIVYVGYLALSKLRNYLRAIKTSKNIQNNAFVVKTFTESGKFRLAVGFFSDNPKIKPEIIDPRTIDKSNIHLFADQGKVVEAKKLDDLLIQLPEGEMFEIQNMELA